LAESTALLMNKASLEQRKRLIRVISSGDARGPRAYPDPTGAVDVVEPEIDTHKRNRGRG